MTRALGGRGERRPNIAQIHGGAKHGLGVKVRGMMSRRFQLLFSRRPPIERTSDVMIALMARSMYFALDLDMLFVMSRVAAPRCTQ